MVTKVADSKGRIALGNQFAGRTFIVRQSESGAIELQPAVVVPEREAWLYKDKAALASVKRGLEQAKQRRFSKNPPDLKADAQLVAKLEDS